MKFTLPLLTTLFALATASPTPDVTLQKRWHPNTLQTPICSFRWNITVQGGVWEPVTGNNGLASHSPQVDTLQVFYISPEDAGKAVSVRFFMSHPTLPPKQAIQIYTNLLVQPNERCALPKGSSSGRNVHIATFRADNSGDAVEIPGEPQAWKRYVFPTPGYYGFSVVGIDVQNPTNLRFDVGIEGIHLDAPLV